MLKNKNNSTLLTIILNLLTFWIFIFQPLFYFMQLPCFDSSCGSMIMKLLSFLLGFFSPIFNSSDTLFRITPVLSTNILYPGKEIYLTIIQTLGIGVLLLVTINKLLFKEKS